MFNKKQKRLNKIKFNKFYKVKIYQKPFVIQQLRELHFLLLKLNFLLLIKLDLQS
jgi:hypothetical protein